MARRIITINEIPEDTTITPPREILGIDQNSDGNFDELVEDLGVESSSSSGGFSIEYTPGQTYDLDEIIESIARDNDEHALIMYVNTKELIVQAVINQCIIDLKEEYNAENLEDILNFQSIFNNYFEAHFAEYTKLARIAGVPGSISIDEEQNKLELNRTDMVKYLFKEVDPRSKVKPILNQSKVMIEWHELSSGNHDNEEVFDGGQFVSDIETISGGNFTDDLSEVEILSFGSFIKEDEYE